MRINLPLLATIAALDLRFEPGEEYYYSNANYYLLGLILDATSGERYETLLKSEILGPLGLQDTGQIYAPGAEIVAPTYLRDGDTYERIEITHSSLFRATGSQYSTVGDLLTFSHGLLNGSLLSEEMSDVLLDQERPMGFTVASVQLADRGVPVISYNGELAGTTTMLTMFPEQEGTIAILSNNNTSYTTLVDMTLAIAQTAF